MVSLIHLKRKVVRFLSFNKYLLSNHCVADAREPIVSQIDKVLVLLSKLYAGNMPFSTLFYVRNTNFGT